MSEKNALATGIYFDRPREGAPSFVRGRISIKVEDAVKMLNEHVNEKGYVNLSLLEAKETKKLYLTVDTWKPQQKENNVNDAFLPDADDELDANSIPF